MQMQWLAQDQRSTGRFARRSLDSLSVGLAVKRLGNRQGWTILGPRQKARPPARGPGSPRRGVELRDGAEHVPLVRDEAAAAGRGCPSIADAAAPNTLAFY
jgi:hypothetical protein